MSQHCESCDLRRINRSHLRVGKPLPGALHDHKGRLLASSGYVLTLSDLDTLRAIAPDGVFAGPDWADGAAASGAATTESSEAGREPGRRAGHRDARKHARHPWEVLVDVELRENDETRTARRRIRVVTCDLSVGGFAFTHRHYIRPGTRLRVQLDRLPGRPRLAAAVRNCIYLRNAAHRIGVEFLHVVELEDRASDREAAGGS